MQVGLQARAWLGHIAVAVCYGIGVSLFRQVIVPHYVLLCGVHVAVLMLTPYRFWPALFVGEAVSQVPMAVECAAQWGLTWALLKPIPGIIYSGPIIYYARERGHLFAGKGAVNIGVLLICALAVSAVMTANDALLMSTIVYPPGYAPIHYDHLAVQWLLGNFLGILTVVPTVLVVYQALLENGWRQTLHNVGESRVTFESACLTLPLLALLIWIGFSMPHVRGIAQVAMFLPVVWLALRHGWQGAAIGGTAASLAVVTLIPENYDHATIQAEVIIAFAIATMLLVGARIGVLDRRAEKERADVRSALALAQRNLHMGEMQLRMTAQSLEQIRDTVKAGYVMMLGRLRHLQPAIDDGGYQRAALVAQDQLHRLADSLHPVTWRERGLPAALSEGAVARILDEGGARYWCELRGSLRSLSTALHITIYRMVCEAIVEGCSKKDISDIGVRIRGGQHQDRRWVAVSIDFRAHPARLAHVRWEETFPRLVRSASGMGMKVLKDRAVTFEGYARERAMSNGRRISWIILDP
jgi:glucose-6-phosphate-specific signal transduction histidine kinase